MPSLAPLEVDPAARERMHRMGPEHVDAVCRLHHAAMGRSLWARLGLPFLRAVYRGLVAHPDFVGFVYQERERVRGFIAGTVNGPRMLRQVLLRRLLPVSLATARGLLRHPGAALPLAETLLYFRRSSTPEITEVVAESMFCSFEPELRGQRISGLINQLLFEEVAARGHRYLKITTEAANEGAVRQLTSWGFEQVGRFRFYGTEMVTWRLDLEECARLQLPQGEG